MLSVANAVANTMVAFSYGPGLLVLAATLTAGSPR